MYVSSQTPTTVDRENGRRVTRKSFPYTALVVVFLRPGPSH